MLLLLIFYIVKLQRYGFSNIITSHPLLTKALTRDQQRCDGSKNIFLFPLIILRKNRTGFSKILCFLGGTTFLVYRRHFVPPLGLV